MNVNPANLYDSSRNSTLASIRRVQSERFVRIKGAVTSSVLLATEGICDVRLSSSRFFRSSLAFPAYKDFPYFDMFNKG